MWETQWLVVVTIYRETSQKHKISAPSDIKHKTLPVIDHYVFLTKYYPVIPHLQRRKPQKGISLCWTNIYVCVNKGQRTPFWFFFPLKNQYLNLQFWLMVMSLVKTPVKEVKCLTCFFLVSSTAFIGLYPLEFQFLSFIHILSSLLPNYFISAVLGQSQKISLARLQSKDFLKKIPLTSQLPLFIVTFNLFELMVPGDWCLHPEWIF